MTKVSANLPVMSMGAGQNMVKVQETDTKGDFSKIFENQKANEPELKTDEVAPREETQPLKDEPVDEVQTAQKEPDAGEVVNSEETKETPKTVETQSGSQTNHGEQEETFSQEMMNLVMAVMPIMHEATVDVKAVLADALGISQGELDVVLEEMGLTQMDLTDVSVVKDVFLQVKGVEDMTALLTDETLYSQMQELEASFEEIMTNVQENLQVSQDEMNVLTAGVREVTVNPVEEPTITVEVTEPQAPAVKTEVTVETMQQPEKEQTSKESAGEQSNEQSGEQNAFLAQGQNQTTANLQDVHASATVDRPQTFAGVQTEQIMNQIMDYMKVQVNADTSMLEMQLQPESLGTLQIRISAKEGVMTAQFTTTSETVRAVLEGQMVQLQQQLDQQNIKVDAIEVLVQTHSFESALAQGEERQQMQEEKKNKVRKINLNISEELEEMPQEDRIVAEMMAANGNTIDYLA